MIFDEDSPPLALTRPYGRVDRFALKRTLLARCAARGVRFVAATARGVSHADDAPSRLALGGAGAVDDSSARAAERPRALEALLVVDATGFACKLIEFKTPFNPGFQVTYGALCDVKAHPYALDEMLLMDWCDGHLAGADADAARTGRAPAATFDGGAFEPTDEAGAPTSLLKGNERFPSFLYAMPLEVSTLRL